MTGRSVPAEGPMSETPTLRSEVSAIGNRLTISEIVGGRP